MILDDIVDKIKEAELPPYFPERMNIGIETSDIINDELLEYNPSENNCTAFAHIKEYKDDVFVAVHTHGIVVNVGDTELRIHNSQIIVFDYYFFDDYVKYKKSENRGDKIFCGTLFGGPIGAAIGLALSFGEGTRHSVFYNLIIAYWNYETKQKEVISIFDTRWIKEKIIPKLVENWKEQVNINEETGREPAGDKMVGVEKVSDGCGWIFYLMIVLTLIFSLLNLL